MNKLLSAGLSRLKTNFVFWAGMVTMFLVSVCHMLYKSKEAPVWIEQGNTYYLDNFYFDIGPFMGVFCAVFISLFIGTEYSDGVMRNKLIVGHTRAQVYLSNFFASLVACESFVVMWIIGGLVGIPRLGFLQMGYEGFIVYVLLSLLYTAALTGIFVMFSMLSSNKTINAVLEILLAALLIMVGSILCMHLGQPAETTVKVVGNVTVDFGGSPFANPAYIGGALRKILQFLADSLPTSQALLMMEMQITRPILSAIASISITIGTLIVGCTAFNKKDLK